MSHRRVEVAVPRLGEDVSKAVLVGWMVRPGDRVQPGDPLFEIETDKAVFEVEAEVEGTVAEVLAEEGAAVVPGQVVLVIEAQGP